MNARIAGPNLQQSPPNGENVEEPKDAGGDFQGVHPSPHEIVRERQDAEEVEGHKVPFHDATHGHDAAPPGSFFQEGFGRVHHPDRDGGLVLSREGGRHAFEIFGFGRVGILAGVAVLETFARPEEFVEVVVVSFVDVIGLGFHVRTNNLKDGSHHIIQKVPGIQTPRRHGRIARHPHNTVLLHHLVIQIPQTFRHVPNIARLAPNAKKEHQVHDPRCHRGRRGHPGGARRHFGKVRRHSLVPTPFHVVAEHLGVERVDGTGGLQRRGEDVAVHVSSIVAQQNEQVLGLVPNGRVLKSEEVPEVLARGVDHVGVLGETGGEVRGIEHVVRLRVEGGGGGVDRFGGDVGPGLEGHVVGDVSSSSSGGGRVFEELGVAVEHDGGRDGAADEVGEG
mmetsp:Transcript_26324/g.55566  ORF Transcript_26324/g.55566 Transcript_26324/m.55566 type:complete len:393 (-) Transcript_26324:369-1547(-)